MSSTEPSKSDQPAIQMVRIRRMVHGGFGAPNRVQERVIDLAKEQELSEEFEIVDQNLPEDSIETPWHTVGAGDVRSAMEPWVDINIAPGGALYEEPS